MKYECPECEYVGDTEFSLKVHYGQSHEGSLSGREYECDWCEETYRDENGKQDQDHHYCSVECKGNWQSQNGHFTHNNPQYEGGPVEVDCSNCSATLQRKKYRVENTENHYCDMDCYSSDSNKSTIPCSWCEEDTEVPPFKQKRDKNHFCSQDCYGEWKSENVVGENHPRYNSIDAVCDNCGNEITKQKCHYDNFDTHFCDENCRVEYQVGENATNYQGGKEVVGCDYCDDDVELYSNKVNHYDHTFCDPECRSAWQSDNIGGPTHHWWTGGTSFYHSIRRNLPDGSWKGTSQDYREGKNCENCGVSPSDLDRELDVHHIIPIKAGGTGSEYNLMALCHSCHQKAENYVRDIVDYPIIQQ